MEAELAQDPADSVLAQSQPCKHPIWQDASTHPHWDPVNAEGPPCQLWSPMELDITIWRVPLPHLNPFRTVDQGVGLPCPAAILYPLTCESTPLNSVELYVWIEMHRIALTHICAYLFYSIFKIVNTGSPKPESNVDCHLDLFQIVITLGRDSGWGWNLNALEEVACDINNLK